MVEQNHQMLEQIQKNNVAADKPNWDRYINLSIMAYNTTYRQLLKCTPIKFFPGCIPYNALDLKFRNPMELNATKVQLHTLIDGVIQRYKDTIPNIFEAFHKKINYFDRKISAQPLKSGNNVYLFNPKYHTH